MLSFTSKSFMIVILATEIILSAEQWLLLEHYFILVLPVYVFRTFNQAVFKPSSGFYCNDSHVLVKKSDLKRRGVMNQYMEFY